MNGVYRNKNFLAGFFTSTKNASIFMILKDVGQVFLMLRPSDMDIFKIYEIDYNRKGTTF